MVFIEGGFLVFLGIVGLGARWQLGFVCLVVLSLLRLSVVGLGALWFEV